MKSKTINFEWECLQREMERLEAEQPDQLNRRYEWTRIMSDKAVESEKERQTQLQNTCSSSLVAQSFLMAAEAAVFAAFFQKTSLESTTNLLRASYGILGVTFAMQIISVFLVLLAVFYRKRTFYNSPRQDTNDFLSKQVSFSHSYSENKGYILVTDQIHKTLCETDDRMKRLVNSSLIVLMFSLIPFAICLILWIIAVCQ